MSATPRPRTVPEYHVTAVWDEEAGAWVATSDDVPGLVAEADTVEELLRAVRDLIPELLTLNGVLPPGDTTPVPFRMTAERSSTARAC